MQWEGRWTQGQERKGKAAAGTGEGGDKGEQAEASGEGAEVAAAGAGGKGEERGEHAARPRADPLNLAERDRLGGSVVPDIHVVLEDEGEEARRMAVKGGQRPPTAPNVPAAAMKSTLPEVQRKEEDKGRRGRTGAGAA